MAKVPPPEHSRWKPGQSGNKGGRPKGQLTADQVSALMGRLSRMTPQELADVAMNPKSSMMEITVASIFAKAAESGDCSRLEFLLSRSIGKVSDKLEVQAKPTMVIHRPDGTSIELTQGEPLKLEAGEE